MLVIAHHVLSRASLPATHAIPSCHPFPHVQVRCQLKLESISDMAHLAAQPGPPCAHLELPQPRSGQPAWEARQAEAELEEAARRLLGSKAFQQRSSSSLTALLNCPLAAAGDCAGLMHRFPALQQLAAGGACGSSTRAGPLSLGRCPPSLRRLTLHLSSGGMLRHASLPAHLLHFEVIASSSSAGGTHCHVAPEEGAGATGSWSTCRSLQLTAAAGGLLLSLDHCQVLRSCTTLRIRGPAVRSSSCRGPAAAATAEVEAGSANRAGINLHRWLHALAPLFAATPLQLFDVQAGSASLHTAPDGSQPLLLVGEGPSCWQPAELSAAALPAGSQQLECLGGLTAELRGCGDDFVLCVRRYEEMML